MIPQDCPEGSRVEVRWPDGWKSGYTFRGAGVALDDKPYRVNVMRDEDERLFLELAPECVRPAKEANNA